MGIANYKSISTIAFVCAILNSVTSTAALAQDIVSEPASYNSQSSLTSLEEDNFLIVEVILNKQDLGEPIEIYQHESGYLVPLGLLAQLLELSITVNTDKKTAKGWFVREENDFLLDLNQNKVTVKGHTSKIDKNIIINQQGDYYVDAKLLSEWFPLTFDLNFSELKLNITSSEKLPAEERNARNLRQQQFRKPHEKTEDYKVIEVPYKLYSVPATDVSIGYNLDSSQNQQQHLGELSVATAGDLLYHSTSLNITGNSRDELTNVRLKAEKHDYKGELLGPMQATSYELGDISSYSLPLAGSTGFGRGFKVTNQDVDKPDQFDSVDIIGDAPVNWDVEIYRNGILLDFQKVDNDGRYEFFKVPIYYGNNNIRIVKYGPQGEIKEETKNYNINNSILKEQQFNYKVSLDEKSSSLFGINEETNWVRHDKAIRSVNSFDYGLTDLVTLSGGTISTPLEDGNYHNYATTGLKSSLFNVFTGTDFAVDLNDGSYAGQVSLNTNIKDINIKATQSYFSDFVSEVQTPLTTPLRSSSNLDFEGQINTKILPSFYYALGGSYNIYQDDKQETEIRNRVGTSVLGVAISNNINYRIVKDDIFTNDNGDGTLSLRGRFKDLLVRSSLFYKLAPDNNAETISLSVQKELADQLSLNLAVDHNFTNNGYSAATITANKQFDQYRLSGSVRGSDNGDFYIGTQISFSFGYNEDNDEFIFSPNSLTTRGGASARTFLDNNYNNVFDANDEIIDDVDYTYSGYKENHQKDSITTITGLNSNRPEPVVIKSDSLDDPFKIPTEEGYKVVSRPGIYTKLDFPIVNTSEIEGNLYITKSKTDYELPNVTLELTDQSGKVISTCKSEFDGYFLFEQVKPGNYSVRIKQTELERLDASNSPTSSVDLTEYKEVVAGLKLIVVSD